MRALRVFLVIVIVLAGLFVAADRIAVKLAEDEAASKIKSSQGVPQSGDVSVDIRGFPFLTQVASKNLDRVDAQLSGLTAKSRGQELTIARIDAQLDHVRLGSDYSSAVAEKATGTARISYADLSKAAPKGVSVSYAGTDKAGKSQVKITGPVTGVLKDAGIDVPGPVEALLEGRKLTAHSTVDSDGDTVRLHADDLPQLPLPGLEDKLREVVDYQLKVDGLPSGLKLGKAEATQRGIELSVEGSDVKLTG